MDPKTAETTALSVREQRAIELLGDEILAIWISDSHIIQVLRLESVPFWLSGVTASKVRPELREKLLTYKRWVVQKVYEAFMSELGMDDQARGNEAQTAVEVSTSATLAALAQVREMGRAIMQMAEAQMDLERRQTTSENRLERAAVVVADIQRRLIHVERRLDPQNVVTEEQTAAISSHVKALAMLITSHDPGKNHFGGIFGELYRRCHVTDYKSIRQDQLDDVIQFLDEWRDKVLSSEAE